MPPHSSSDMGRGQSAKHNQDILEISENIQKIDLQSTKTEDENCTYNIDEDEEEAPEEEGEDDDSTTTTNTTDFENCATIKEKGPIKPEKNNNTRLIPYSRNSTSGAHISSILNDIQFDNIDQLFSQDDNYAYNNEFSGNTVSFLDDQLLQFCDSSSTYEDVYYLQSLSNAENIPATNEPVAPAQTSTNCAEQALSNYIDGDKKLKQVTWIMVNTKIEQELISMLRDKIASARFTQTELNFIYAIIFRLMKKESNVDGKRLLVDYFLSDVDILFKIAIKGNFLLMDYILEVYQNLGIDPSKFNVLHQIVDYSHVDLCQILDGLLNKTFDNKPSFNVNSVDSAEQTILMVVLKNISLNKGLLEVNMKYLDVILRQFPNITYVTRNGRNIFHDVVNCGCNEEIIQYFCKYYDANIIQNMINQTYDGWGLYQNIY